MTKPLIEKYYNDIESITRFGGSRNESTIREAFKKLLKDYCQKKDFLLLTELEYKTPFGTIVKPDGTVKDSLRLDWGYWESKDEYDDLDIEIKKKFEKGYPKDNIIFEDSKRLILYQGGKQAANINMNESDALDRILIAFINYERPEVKNFRNAIEKFKEDIPKVTEALRSLIEIQTQVNPDYILAKDKFIKLCRVTINPNIVTEDIREMLIQHILTEEIFSSVFDEPYFHRENNIARELDNLSGTFFTGDTRKKLLSNIRHYYNQIKAAAAGIANHSEKQKFLKIIYENFYKAYNPKKADRLGVVYTPNEIVKFMVESADYLCYKHFGKLLSDKNVEILDPAVGTGTFITDLIEYLPLNKLQYKYDNEIHANEVGILPYYIANLNIEYTYKQKTGEYKEFKNICFVDTLDNLGFSYKGQQIDAFAGFAVENKERIKRQNERNISVIIGNPPYNANQMNENENNKNREYREIDKRIKDTFIKNSTAQKTKMYDMYVRFYRWAIDRIDEDGIVALITNRSFINGRTADGFRKTLQDEFDYIYVVDLNGDLRSGNKSGQGNVFNIKTGVAITFLIKKREFDLKGNPINKLPAQIYYASIFREGTASEKLDYLVSTKFKEVPFDRIAPDKNNNWIDLADNDFEKLIPLKRLKGNNGDAICVLAFNGVNTARDEWVFDFNKNTLIKKIHSIVNYYNSILKKVKNNKDILKSKKFWDSVVQIKWSEALKNYLKRNIKIRQQNNKIIKASYRPFITKYFYSEKYLNDRLTNIHHTLFGKKFDLDNVIICISTTQRQPFAIFAVKYLPTFQFFMDPAQSISLYYYENNMQNSNITDWALEQFRKQYGVWGLGLGKFQIFKTEYQTK